MRLSGIAVKKGAGKERVSSRSRGDLAQRCLKNPAARAVSGNDLVTLTDFLESYGFTINAHIEEP